MTRQSIVTSVVGIALAAAAGVVTALATGVLGLTPAVTAPLPTTSPAPCWVDRWGRAWTAAEDAGEGGWARC